MNVYVETNFVLELVFEQEQAEACESILELSEEDRIRLMLPAYCLAEPLEKLSRQSSNRRELQRTLNVELVQLTRTQTYRERVERIEDVAKLLVESSKEESLRFQTYRDRLLATVEIVPLDVSVITEAAAYESTLRLSPQDALVYASIMAHLRLNLPTSSCFLNKNSKDFDVPDIVDELVVNNCKLIPRFDHGCSFILSQIASSDP